VPRCQIVSGGKPYGELRLAARQAEDAFKLLLGRRHHASRVEDDDHRASRTKQ
jgi:hypothetical protein